MHTTPVSLLLRLNEPTDSTAWTQFVQLYTPLLYHWARRLGFQDSDASDLVQDVLLVLLRKLPEFRYNRRQRFRGWLWTIVLNKGRERWRQQDRADALEAWQDRATADTTQEAEDQEYASYLARRALELMQADFQPATWQACWQQIVEGRPAADVARDLGLSLAAVYIAKSRVLRRLRQELDGLWPE